jgi:5-oxoprolinase (ATP-hydrolysing)
MTNTRITDVEVFEARCPARLRRFGVRHGSGGDGLWRGGNGVVREIEFVEPVRLSLLSERRTSSPFGMDGGGSGHPGQTVLIASDGTEDVLGGRFTRTLECGDCVRIETPGGGGFGGGVEVL